MSTREQQGLNRYRILDTRDGRYMHIGYDTRATAKRACNAMEQYSGTGKSAKARRWKDDRYRVVDTAKEIPTLSKPEARMEALRVLVDGRKTL